MVSKAREDLPEPLTPVTTIRRPSGRSRETPLRLFCRAPRIRMCPSVPTGARAARPALGRARGVDARPALGPARGVDARPAPGRVRVLRFAPGLRVVFK